MNQNSEILIIGGGIIGLSLAIELKLRGISVKVLSREPLETATRAAAGMLAPQAEQIPPSAMLDLCLRSRDLYQDWVHKLTEITGLNTGYWSCGILAPVYEKAGISTFNQGEWLDENAIHSHQPGLSQEVIGGWWYPLDGQVDNRQLYETLIVAASRLKIEILRGVLWEIIHDDQKVMGLKTSLGELKSDQYILATGAWSEQLLPIPVYPIKGQMMSIKVTPERPDNLPLNTVLFGTEIYIVPRQDGRIVLGATSEKVGFQEGNTPQGINTLLSGALRLFPELKHYEIEELWSGFRPGTPDECPILGPSMFDNLTLATGHYRNGILLAPVTALLIADFVLGQNSDPLLANFSSTRFN